MLAIPSERREKLTKKPNKIDLSDNQLSRVIKNVVELVKVDLKPDLADIKEQIDGLTTRNSFGVLEEQKFDEFRLRSTSY